MNQMLNTIVAAKKVEVASLKEQLTITDFEKSYHYQRNPHSLSNRLLEGNTTGIIAEFKRRSPSKGAFTGADIAIEPIVQAYEQHGAAGISVLTDHQFFGGSLIDLHLTRQAVGIPLLRKDFMIDPIQIHQAKADGADVILLIAAILTPQQVKSFAAEAASIGLESILEIHDEGELGHICDEVDMIGVNNRNLQTFEVNIETSLRLIKKLPADRPLISESGISNAKAIVSLQQAGYSGFLIGEHFMRQPEPAIAFARFTATLSQGVG